MVTGDNLVLQKFNQKMNDWEIKLDINKLNVVEIILSLRKLKWSYLLNQKIKIILF